MDLFDSIKMRLNIVIDSCSVIIMWQLGHKSNIRNAVWTYIFYLFNRTSVFTFIPVQSICYLSCGELSPHYIGVSRNRWCCGQYDQHLSSCRCVHPVCVVPDTHFSVKFMIKNSREKKTSELMILLVSLSFLFVSLFFKYLVKCFCYEHRKYQI